MDSSFDPYGNWLGIPAEQRPPTLYGLLGLPTFESQPAVIEAAFGRTLARLAPYRHGPQAALAEKLVREVEFARAVLLDPGQRARYDAQSSGPARGGAGDLSGRRPLPRPSHAPAFGSAPHAPGPLPMSAPPSGPAPLPFAGRAVDSNPVAWPPGYPPPASATSPALPSAPWNYPPPAAAYGMPGYPAPPLVPQPPLYAGPAAQAPASPSWSAPSTASHAASPSDPQEPPLPAADPPAHSPVSFRADTASGQFWLWAGIGGLAVATMGLALILILSRRQGDDVVEADPPAVTAPARRDKGASGSKRATSPEVAEPSPADATPADSRAVGAAPGEPPVATDSAANAPGGPPSTMPTTLPIEVAPNVPAPAAPGTSPPAAGVVPLPTTAAAAPMSNDAAPAAAPGSPLPAQPVLLPGLPTPSTTSVPPPTSPAAAAAPAENAMPPSGLPPGTTPIPLPGSNPIPLPSGVSAAAPPASGESASPNPAPAASPSAAMVAVDLPPWDDNATSGAKPTVLAALPAGSEASATLRLLHGDLLAGRAGYKFQLARSGTNDGSHAWQIDLVDKDNKPTPVARLMAANEQLQFKWLSGGDPILGQRLRNGRLEIAAGDGAQTVALRKTFDGEPLVMRFEGTQIKLPIFGLPEATEMGLEVVADDQLPAHKIEPAGRVAPGREVEIAFSDEKSQKQLACRVVLYRLSGNQLRLDAKVLHYRGTRSAPIKVADVKSELDRARQQKIALETQYAQFLDVNRRNRPLLAQAAQVHAVQLQAIETQISQYEQLSTLCDDLDGKATFAYRVVGKVGSEEIELARSKVAVAAP